MAMRATPTARALSSFQNLRTHTASFVPKLQLSLLTSTATFTITLTTPKDANAIPISKDQVETAIDLIQGVGSGVLDFSKSNIKVVINLALPILQKSGDQALKIASPVIEEASKKTQEAIESSGLNPEPIYRVAKTVGDLTREAFEVFIGAKPFALSAFENILSAEPITIVEASGGLLVTYVLLPPIWSAASFKLRGYKGKLSAAQTLDLLCRRNHLMIDIRSKNDKNNAGAPLLPFTAKNKMISLPAEELPSKVKGLVRDTKKAEAGITALKISYLKRINRHSNIIIMDSYCDMAKTVARDLTKLGFKNCWIVAGGFSGRQGWSQSYLGIDSCNSSRTEVLPLPRVISPTIGKLHSEDKLSS